MTDSGLTTTPSKYPVKETIDRIGAAITANEWTIFARIDHAANAEHHGVESRPTELLIFGNPTVGTLLMQEQQTTGVDLPTKVLAWEDEEGKVWLTYNDAAWIARRHGLGRGSGEAIEAIEAVLAIIREAATS